jgi:monoamine oxidase
MKVCIIGSGISGLYAGLILKKKNHDITIFEAKSKIGGRIENRTFAGERVIAGAGIGRKSDVLLKQLCDELGVPTMEFQAKSLYYGIKPKVTPIETIKKIKDYINRNPENQRRTFKQVASSFLGRQQYKDFVAAVGETDYEYEDVIDVVNDYGFDKSFSSGFTAFSINWDRFLAAFNKHLRKNIKLNTKVDRIEIMDDKYRVNHEVFDCIIVATTIDQTKKILSYILPPKSMSLYDNVACQPFARVYAQLDTPLDKLQNYRSLITVDPFQKIIEMNRDKCIYMISYSDNDQALFWKKNQKRLSATIQQKLLSELGITRKVLKSQLYFWNCGTQYCKPLPTAFTSRQTFLKKAQRPAKNIFVIGEGFSRNHGWCEGALESVQAILN